MTSCYVLKDGITEATMETDYYFDYEGYANGDCDLDETNMYHFARKGTYGYIMTEDHPYVPYGLRGTPASVCGFTPSNR